MALEIERKFLVKDKAFLEAAERHVSICQYYLHQDESGGVRRVRFLDDKVYLTIKGLSSPDGLVREEVEREISPAEGQTLLALGHEGKVCKTRYYIPYASYLWEVDVFHEELEGLIIAEVELASLDAQPSLPSWVGEEVTGDVRYYNSALARVGHYPLPAADQSKQPSNT